MAAPSPLIMEDLPTEMLIEIFDKIPTIDLFINVLEVSTRFRNIILSVSKFKRETFVIQEGPELSTVLRVLDHLGTHLKNLVISNRAGDYEEIINYAKIVNRNLLNIRLHNAHIDQVAAPLFIWKCTSSWPNLNKILLTSGTRYFPPPAKEIPFDIQI